jgi:hypothetical protein
LSTLFPGLAAPDDDTNGNDEQTTKDHEKDLPPLRLETALLRIGRGIGVKRGNRDRGNGSRIGHVNRLGKADPKPTNGA